MFPGGRRDRERVVELSQEVALPRGFLYADRGRVQMRSRLEALVSVLSAILEERVLWEGDSEG
jgi:hypothetical protein